MKTKFIALLLILVCVGFNIARAQSRNYPFAPGEVLTYEAKLNKSYVRGFSLGGADVTFKTVSAPTGNNLIFFAEAVSKGNLLKLFRLKFLERFESTVDSNKFRILKTAKRDEQNDRIRESEATFDYNQKQVTYIEVDPNDKARPPRRIASAIKEDTQDLISAVYSLRVLPLTIGKTFELTISDSGLIYKIPVRVTGRDSQETVLGKIWCFRLEPEVFGPNRFIEEKGSMTIWITEDARRLPVRAEIDASAGKISVRLKKISK